MTLTCCYCELVSEFDLLFSIVVIGHCGIYCNHNTITPIHNDVARRPTSRRPSFKKLTISRKSLTIFFSLVN